MFMRFELFKNTITKSIVSKRALHPRQNCMRFCIQSPKRHNYLGKTSIKEKPYAKKRSVIIQTN